MPAIAALVFGLQLLCLAHIIRTGRRCQWLFIIMAHPLAGCLDYLLLEILPELRHSRAARQAVRDPDLVAATVVLERHVERLVEGECRAGFGCAREATHLYLRPRARFGGQFS